MKNEDFVTYEQAVKLKELGFDWECNFWYEPKEGDNLYPSGMYNNHNTSKIGISGPTLAQTQKWLREVKNICVCSVCNVDNKGKCEYHWRLTFLKEGKSAMLKEFFETYEQALSEGIDAALNFLKNQN